MATDVVAALRAAGCVFAEEEAALLLATADTDQELIENIARRVRGEPLEQILGFVDFMGDRYQLGPEVFIPRQRSALLVQEAVRLGGKLVLDLCCGCGALGLAVSSRLNADLIAADIDSRSVAYAQLNGVAQTHVGDLFNAVPEIYRGTVDLLIANTPYVPTAALADMPREARDFEPRTSLDGGADGMDIQRRVLEEAPGWLVAGGHLLTETSRAQATTLAQLASDVGLHPRVVSDPELGATVLVARLPS